MKMINILFCLLCVLGFVSCDKNLQANLARVERQLETKGIFNVNNKKVEDLENINLENINKEVQPQIEVDVAEGPKVLGESDLDKPRKKVNLEQEQEEVYNKLVNDLDRYKAKLLEPSEEFRSKSNSPYFMDTLHALFNKLGSKFDNVKQYSHIYASLEYDVVAIENLKILLEKLDLDYPSSIDYGDTKIANNLLNLLWQISFDSEKFINYLSNANLAKIKSSKTLDKIIKINTLLNRFMQEREIAVSTAKEQIALLASITQKENLIDELNKTIDLDGSNSNDKRTIKSVSYSIVDLEFEMQSLINN